MTIVTGRTRPHGASQPASTPPVSESVPVVLVVSFDSPVSLPVVLVVSFDSPVSLPVVDSPVVEVVEGSGSDVRTGGSDWVSLAVSLSAGVPVPSVSDSGPRLTVV